MLIIQIVVGVENKDEYVKLTVSVDCMLTIVGEMLITMFVNAIIVYECKYLQLKQMQ